MAQSDKAKGILSQAGAILQQVEEAEIFKVVTQRKFPTFKRSELGLGPILGVGGSCTVREITATRLRQLAPADKPLMESSVNDQITNSNDQDGDGPLEYEDAHLDFTTAREFIASHCLRDGGARYAVKRLRTDLSEVARASAILDLAIEAKILTVISHPNIIKMRGFAEGNPIRQDYFLVLDRLYGTLVDKMEEWKAKRKRHKGFWRIGENKQMLNKLLLDQMLTAYDLAAAFRYLHGHNLLYRDVKPENIGFDIRDDLKVFDFGLVKELHPKLHRGDGQFKLTGRTGTRPYMAPEVALSNPYGKPADAYSYAILLWEILSLTPPYEGLDERNYHRQVVLGGQRPVVSDSWPSCTRKIMTDCFSRNPQDRQSFGYITSILREDLASLTDDEGVLHRDRHMTERSAQSRADSHASEPSQHGFDGRDEFEMMKDWSLVTP